jgi:pectin methylesterase-like acyl-CoA thioesterase
MKKTYHVIISLFVLYAMCTPLLTAQNVASSVTWPLTSAAPQTAQVTGQIQTDSMRIGKNLMINGYSGPSSSQRIKMNPVWPTNQLTQLDTVFIQFMVKPQTSYQLRVDSVVMSLGANSTQDMMANLYYSKDSTFATKTPVSYKTSVAARVGKPDGVFLNSSNLDFIRFAPSMTLNQGEIFYYRIYPWVDSSTSVSGKYICLQNVTVYATAIPIPITASALWPLHSNGTATVSGLLNANAIKFDGTDLYHYGYNGTTGDRWTTTFPSKGSWPAETSPNFSRYAQFSVGPQTGGTFYAMALSFNMIYEFTTTLRAAVYYSNDSTFAKKVFVADTTVPAVKTAYSFPLRDTVASGQMMYVRVYPYNLAADPSWKLVDVDSFKVAGATTGLAILAPTVTTNSVTYISTTFATSGGNITADGGGAITSRGVCWDTVTAPTIIKSKTADGTGIGTYTSSVTGLLPGKAYYLRAYATNAGGTAYGSEQTFTTLSAMVAPTVTTAAIKSILVKTAISGGTVTLWGGDSVKARGICWNTTGNPTVSNNKTVDGSDIGSFASGLTGLIGNTMYHVRAYATNSAGTGYGGDSTFTTQTQQRDTTVVVAKDGSGNYTTLQAAFNAVPINYTGTWKIFVKKGKYHEKDTLAAGKVNVVLEGELRDSTVIWYDDFSDKYGSGNPGTSGTFTITLNADDFIAKNITFENTYWPSRYGSVSGTQGVAVSANGDRQEFVNCAFNGYQDTYYTRGSTATGRAYHKKCIFKGTVDYIFGRNICVFDSCTFITIRNGGTITAGATDPTSLYGYVFRNCTLLGDTIASTDSTGWVRAGFTSANGYYLGRPWQGGPRTVYMNCYESANLSPIGWTTMSVNPTLYAEFKCYGPGFTSSRGTVSGWPTANQARQLTYAEAATYSLTTIFGKSSASSSLMTYDWMPVNATPGDNLPLVVSVAQNQMEQMAPKEFKLHQNYPNPFNPSTIIRYDLPSASVVTLKVYDLYGREVAILVNGMTAAGTHQETFHAQSLASGVYFARLKSDVLSGTIKLLLVK